MIIAATPTKKISGNVLLDVESHPVMLALKISLPAIGNRIATAIITTTIPIAVAVRLELCAIPLRDFPNFANLDVARLAIESKSITLP